GARLGSARPSRALLATGALAGGILASAASGIATGRPVFGLAALGALPWAVAQAQRALARRQQAALERSAVPFFQALHGLVRVGISLPAALFRLAEAVPSPFARTLRTSLGAF